MWPCPLPILAGYSWMPTLSRAGAPLIPRVADLVDAGMIKVVTTDQTKTEIAKKPRRERFPGDRRPHEAPGAGFGRRDTGREDTDDFLLPHHPSKASGTSTSTRPLQWRSRSTSTVCRHPSPSSRSTTLTSSGCRSGRTTTTTNESGAQQADRLFVRRGQFDGADFEERSGVGARQNTDVS